MRSHLCLFPRGCAILLCVIVVIASYSVPVAHANELDDRLYDDMPQKPCVRMISATGSVGCSTSKGSSRVSGLLFYIDSASRVEEFRGLNDDNERAVLMTPAMFTGDTVDRINTPLLNGIIVLPSPQPVALSPASTRPQGDGGLSPDYEWNPDGTNMLNQRYKFPIVTVDTENGAKLLTSAQENHDAGTDAFPQNAVDFLFDMGPDGLTSFSCLRNAQCLPVGGHSVWGTIGTFDATKQQVFLTSNLDSNAMFHDLAVGAAGTASDIATLLGAVQALAGFGVSDLPYQIAYGLFQGEAWGRIGSRRFVSEVESFTCKAEQDAADSITGKAFCKNPVRTDLSFEQLSGTSFAHVIAVDQAGAGSTTTAYMHKTASNPLTAAALNAASGGVLTVSESSVSEVPPTPVTSFVQQWNDVNGIVLSSYDTMYSNAKYFSAFDTASNVDAAQAAKFATVMARSAYALAAGWNTTAAAANVPAELQADADFVTRVIQCLTENADCSTFADILSVSTTTLSRFTGTGPLSLYTGVNRPSRAIVSSSGKGGFVIQPKIIELVVRTFLNNATADVRRGACTSTSECKDIDVTLECQVGTCVVPTAHYHEALSSSLESNGGSGYFLFESNVNEPHADPLWTEPYWSADIGIRTFLAGDPDTDTALLVTGIGVVLLSILAAWWLHRSLTANFKLQ